VDGKGEFKIKAACGVNGMTKQIRATSRNGVVSKLDPRSSSFARDFRRAAKLFSAKTTESPAKALATLVDMGILTPGGRLSKNYR
jgi:hypothetical protein